MKVAVISNTKQVGKSSLMFLLASVYSKSHQKRVALFSTSSMSECMEYVDIKENATPAKSVSVFKALFEAGQIDSEEVWDYGYRVGKEEVFCFNIFGAQMDNKALLDLQSNVINRINADLTIIEITGDANTERTNALLKEVDAVIYVMNLSPKGVADVKLYKDTTKPAILLKTAFVCQKYAEQVMSERQIAKLIDVPVRSLILIPYSPAIIRETLSGTLDMLGQLIIEGQYDVVLLRIKMYELMMFLFGTGPKSGVKEVKGWHR